MTSSNEPGQPVGFMTPPAQGDGASEGGGAFAPPTFAPPGFTPPNAQPGLNTMAVLALVFVFVFSPLGVVFGVLGRRQIARTGERGKGLATAGLILGALFTLLGIVGVALLVVLAANTPNSVSKSAVESQVSSKIAESTGTRPESVSCASDLAATVGATDACTAVVSGASIPLTVVVTSFVDKTVSFDVKNG